MYDVAIIGAGPAGSTCARLLGGALHVLLVDRRELHRPYHPGADKCCGGLLAPDAQEALARLRLGIPREVLCGPQLFTVRTLDLDSGRERYYQRFYINTDRQKLDRHLLSLAPAGVELRLGVNLLSLEESGSGHTLRLAARDGKVFTERAHLLIGCDGAASLVRRRLFPRAPRPRAYLALQEWFEQPARPLPHFGAVFWSRLIDFYAWTIPKEEELVLGAALSPGREVREKFERLKDRLRALGLRLDRPVRRQAAWLLRPRSPADICLGSPGAALAGEAAGFISPSSAEGISFALLSARALALALEGGIDGFQARYRSLTRSLRLKILMKNFKSPFIFRPGLRALVMRSGLSSMKVDRAD